MTDRIPICWKCASKITEPNKDFPPGSVLIGCKECEGIHNYDDAKTMCPVLKEMEANDGETNKSKR